MFLLNRVIEANVEWNQEEDTNLIWVSIYSIVEKERASRASERTFGKGLLV